MDKVDLDRLRERRGYGLGERDPDTLPQGKGWDTESQDAESSRKWERIRVAVERQKPGGKYWH